MSDVGSGHFIALFNVFREVPIFFFLFGIQKYCSIYLKLRSSSTLSVWNKQITCVIDQELPSVKDSLLSLQVVSRFAYLEHLHLFKGMFTASVIGNNSLQSKPVFPILVILMVKSSNLQSFLSWMLILSLKMAKVF